MGPSQVGALGRCPSCPGLGPGLFRFIMGSEFFLDTEEGGSFHTVKGLKVQHQGRPFITHFIRAGPDIFEARGEVTK